MNWLTLHQDKVLLPELLNSFAQELHCVLVMQPASVFTHKLENHFQGQLAHPPILSTKQHHRR